LELSIVSGKTVLLEEVSEVMDPSLDSIFLQSTFREDGVLKIKLGDKSLLYDANFKLLMTTKIANPHFLPEICIKLTVINFSITFEGLEEQMLVDVIKVEAPEVEEQRDTLIVELAKSRNDLYKLQS
jgi:dynein heavy chain